MLKMNLTLPPNGENTALYLMLRIILAAGFCNFTSEKVYFTTSKINFYCIFKVDHFGYANDDYFMQRCLINLDYYASGSNGTAFVYAGNEGDIEMFTNNTGFMWEHAKMFNAALLFIEHRYYGNSLPYGNLSFKDIKYLGYLTSEQALADYAAVIKFFKKQFLKDENVPVIVFGGSYGGMLSAWFRIKYPHIANGAIASSAPVLQFGDLIPCNTFAEIVTKDFVKEGMECATSIHKSWPILRKIFNTTTGMKFLVQNFHLCENSFAIDDLIQWLSDTWSYMAMTDYPYPTSFLVPLPAYPIKEACSYLKNSSVPDQEIVFNIYQAASVFHNHSGQVSCFDLKVSAGKSLGDAGWQFQACTEMVQPVCQTGFTDMFELLKWNYTTFGNNCFKKYGVKPEMYKTYLMYGSDHMKSSSNIVFTNGLLDPWYGGGILKNISDTIIAITIKDAAHHLDLRSSNPADPPSVINARKQLVQWIQRFKSETISK